MHNLISNPFELSDLKIIDKKALETFVQDINNDDSLEDLVIALGTGGTISMSKNAEGSRIPELTFEQVLQKSASNITDKFTVKGFNAFLIDSSQMTYEQVREIAISICYIYKNIKKDFMGFIISHGTDTMAYTGANLSLMTGKGLPFSIVLTGAQKPITETLSDAQQNIQMSLLTLEALHKQDMAEVVICMGNRAVLANGALKSDEEHINAFDTPLHEYVCRFDNLRYPLELAQFLKPRIKDTEFAPEIWQNTYSSTLIVHSVVGLNPELISEQIKSDKVKAVILYTYGASTADNKIIDAISIACQDKGILAFSVNPINGDIRKSLYPSAQYLVSKNILPIQMSLATTLAKLEIALCKYPYNSQDILTFMQKNYVGEMPENQ